MKESEQPVGGIQVIASGDFFQHRSAMAAPPRYAFEFEAWQEGIHEGALLTEIHRQEHPSELSV